MCGGGLAAVLSENRGSDLLYSYSSVHLRHGAGVSWSRFWRSRMLFFVICFNLPFILMVCLALITDLFCVLLLLFARCDIS